VGCRFFCEYRHNVICEVVLGPFWPRAQPLDQSISLKFLLETKPESESFEPLILQLNEALALSYEINHLN